MIDNTHGMRQLHARLRRTFGDALQLEAETGGGCCAVAVALPNGGQLLITQAEAPDVPETPDEPVNVTLYDRNCTPDDADRVMPFRDAAEWCETAQVPMLAAARLTH